MGTVLPVLIGGAMIVGAAMDIEYLLKWGKISRTLEATVGRKGLRIGVGVLGACVASWPIWH